MASQSTSVLVVGGRLFDLSAAMLSAQRGVPAALVERHASSSPHPRAKGFMTRTMEIFRAAGIGDKVPQIPSGTERPRRIKVEKSGREMGRRRDQSDAGANPARSRRRDWRGHQVGNDACQS